MRNTRFILIYQGFLFLRVFFHINRFEKKRILRMHRIPLWERIPSGSEKIACWRGFSAICAIFTRMFSAFRQRIREYAAAYALYSLDLLAYDMENH